MDDFDSSSSSQTWVGSIGVHQGSLPVLSTRLDLSCGPGIFLCYFLLIQTLVHGYVRGLLLFPYLALKHWITAKSSFYHDINHEKTIERTSIETYRNGDKRHAINIVLLFFYSRVTNVLVEFNIACNPLTLYKQYSILWVVHRFIVMIISSRVPIILAECGMVLWAMPTILEYEGQYLRVFQDLGLVESL